MNAKAFARWQVSVAVAVVGINPAQAQSGAQPEAPSSTDAQNKNDATKANVSDASLDDIIVTATRSATTLQKTPIAVTALSTDALQQRGVTRLDEISQFSPSFSSGNNGDRIAIRGIGVDTNASQASVGVYIDDVFYNAGNNVGLYDIDRVEILRGPQGTLFGRNTIGGAVQYFSRKPTYEFGGYADVIVGSRDRHDFQGALNVPFGDTLSLRVSGNSQNRDGYVLDVFNNRYYGGIDQQQARAILRWQPFDRLTVDLQAQYRDDKRVGNPVVTGPLVGGVINPNAQFVGLARLRGETRPLTDAYGSKTKFSFAGYNAPQFTNSEFHSYQGNVLFALTDNIDFKSITGWSRERSNGATDFDLTPLQILSGAGSTYSINRLFTQENQLIGNLFDERLRFTIGYYHFNNSIYNVGSTGIFIGNVQSLANGDSQTDIVADAVYGQATFKLTDSLSVTGGLRYSKEKNTGFNRLSTNPPLISKFNDTSPYIGADLQITSDIFVYAKYSKGFKAGGQNINANLPGGSLAFGPEVAKTYEGGARIQLFDRTLRINPTVFFTDYSDIQFNTLIPLANTVVAGTQNAGSAKIKGLELEAQFQPTRRLTFTLAASFIDSQYKKVPALTRTLYLNGFPGPATILPNITLDTGLNRSPKTRISGGANYRMPITTSSDLSFSLSATYTSSQFSAVTISDQIPLPAYTVAQGRIQYDFGDRKYSIAAFATNLFDEYYFIAGTGFGRGYTVGVDSLTPGRPREFGVQATARF